MPRKSKKQAELDRQREQERLLSPVNLTGEGEDPAIQKLLSPEFLKMTNLDATDVALMLQQIIRGQNSLLTLAKQNSDDIARIKSRQDRIDKDLIAREAARKSEIEDILQRAEKLKLTGNARDKIIAKGGKMFEKALQEARAGKAADQIKYAQKLAAEPKELVVSPGKIEMQMQAGRQVAVHLPEEIRIKRKTWVFPPGVPVEVPRSVAQALRDRHASQEETRKRQELLSKKLNANSLANEWNKVEGSRTAALPHVPSA